jgi:hypothetical protein
MFGVMRILIPILFIILLSFGGKEPVQVVNNQGVFDFPAVMKITSTSEIPEYLDESRILCKGKGLKVARCISSQLKTGKCLGILKEGNQVFVVEIDCDNVKDQPEQELELSEE